MLVISPCLQPSRANIILAANEKQLKLDMISKNQKYKESFNDKLIQNIEAKTKILVTNPLFFHGMRMISMLKCYFQRVKQSQNLAALYNECDKLVQRKFMADQLNKQQQARFKELITRIQTSNQAKHHIKLADVEKLIRKSRLLYSNITQQLFIFGSQSNLNEEDELFESLP